MSNDTVLYLDETLFSRQSVIWSVESLLRGHPPMTASLPAFTFIIVVIPGTRVWSRSTQRSR